MIKVLSCVPPDTELACIFDAEDNTQRSGYITGVSLSFFSDGTASIKLNVRELKTATNDFECAA